MARLLVLSTLLLSMGGDAALAEDRVAETAEDRTRRIASAFPEPGAEHAFSVRMRVLQAGSLHATLVLSAEPATVDGVNGWRVRDVLEPRTDGGDRVVTEAFLDAKLGAVRGTYARHNAQGFLTCAWHRGADGAYRFEHKTQEYENQLQSKRTEPAQATLAGILLFLRLAPETEAQYAFPDLDPDPPAGDDLVAPAVLEIHGVAPWQLDAERPLARIVSYTRGHRSYRLALDAETRSFLGLTIAGMSLAVAPPGVDAVGLADVATSALATPHERAAARAKPIRRRLAVPARRFAFEGDLLLGDHTVGHVRLAAEPASFGGRPAWLVTESTVRQAGEARVLSEWSGFLARDLSLLRGETIERSPSGDVRRTYQRVGDRMETMHLAKTQRIGPVQTPLRADATKGLVAVVLFLQSVPAAPATYVLPGFDPRYATTPKAGSGSLPADLADAHVEVMGDGAYSDGRTVWRTMRARVSARTGRRYEVHLDRQTRELVAVVGEFPSLTMAPKGTGGNAPDWFDHVGKPPRNAYDAFITFGRGYHLPRRDLLEEAFHWPTMLAHEIEAGNYPPDTPLAAFTKDWIDEFVRRSKHRTVADCDDLLLQILMTCRESRNADGTFAIGSLPVYGGHTYTMAEIGNRWYIVQVD